MTNFNRHYSANRAPFNLFTLHATFSYACVTTSCTCTVFRGNANHVWLPGNFCSRLQTLFSSKWRHPIPQVVGCIAHIRSFFSRDTCNQSTFLTSSRVLSSRAGCTGTHRPSTFWARPTGVAGCGEGGGRESGCCDIIYGWHVAPCAGASEVAPPGLSVSPLHLDSMRSSH